MIVSKIHKRGSELLLAACDSELIGKTLKLENGAEIKILESFYLDKVVSEKELIELAKDCTTANFFGQETINALVKAGIISENEIMILNDVPHSQIYKMF